jgi:topoisomerase IA-like protein
VAANFEYWTAVFGVGLDGFSDFDHDELNAIAAEGWEPVHLAAVHNGFAAVVLFRRELEPELVAAVGPARKAAKKSTTKAVKAARATKATKAARGAKKAPSR